MMTLFNHTLKWKVDEWRGGLEITRSQNLDLYLGSSPVKLIFLIVLNICFIKII